MKINGKKLLSRGVAFSCIALTSLHATNGDTMISVGTKARGMGGAGIAVSHCAESTLHNPSLITCTKGTSISFGGIVFMPDINTKMGMAAEHESEADINVIPSISISHKLNENWYLGIGMWGTAGMGVDYRDAPQVPGMDSGNMHMVTNLQLMQFGISAAYKANGFSAALTPILQYGSLDINYQGFDGSSVGDGVAQDLNFGMNVGVSYDFANGLTLGAVYKSKIDMDYGNQLSNATRPFADLGIFPDTMGDHLEQPAEIGLGIGYQLENHTFAVDYKKIQWSDAEGYKDFGWSDQNVLAFGYQYTRENWALRLGYNHASHPIDEMPSAPTNPVTPTDYPYAAGNAVNLFNLLGFPATAKRHFTLGGTYAFTDLFAVDLAYVHTPKTTTTMHTIVGYSDNATPAYPGDDALYVGESSVNHTENSLSFQLTYTF